VTKTADTLQQCGTSDEGGDTAGNFIAPLFLMSVSHTRMQTKITTKC